MSALPLHRARIDPGWIDYNGHLRDAYYGVVLSEAIDGVMDHIGVDAAYRAQTRCTLYTLEWHMHYLHEVKGTDALEVEPVVLGADRKRLHLGCRFRCAGDARTVATGDVMLLHVHQGATPSSAFFPAGIEQRLADLALDAEAAAAWGPASRKIELRRRAAQ